MLVPTVLSLLLLAHPFVGKVTRWLDDVGVSYELEDRVLYTSSPSRRLHLVPTEPRSPILTKNMTDFYSNETVIHLHQDVWENHPEIVRNRLLEKLGVSSGRRIFGRKTRVERLTKEDAQAFLLRHHLWGPVNCKYYYGLRRNDNDDLVAVTAWSARRKVKRGGDRMIHRSVELVRYCSKGTVVGGISKMMKHFTRTHAPDDIVTIIDRDWGTAEGWHGLGFDTVQVLPPSMWVVQTESGIRTSLVGALDKEQLPFLSDLALDPTESALHKHGYVAIYGAGMERLFMLCDRQLQDSAQQIWDHSIPCYPLSYYSHHSGVSQLLERAKELNDEHGLL